MPGGEQKLAISLSHIKVKPIEYITFALRDAGMIVLLKT